MSIIEAYSLSYISPVVVGGGTVVKKSQNCAEIPKIVFGATLQFWLKTNYIMIQNKEYKTIFLNFKHFVP